MGASLQAEACLTLGDVHFAGCTFEVVAYTTSRSCVPQEIWVEGEPASPVSTNGDLPSIVPIKSAQAGSGAFRLQLYAEY